MDELYWENAYASFVASVLRFSIIFFCYNLMVISGMLNLTDLIYRDIKGANLLVDAFGVVKLADFGMAKHVSYETF